MRDVDYAVDLGLRVRVVKGEWSGLDGDETDRSEGFMSVVERLAKRRARHVAIATHDAGLADKCLERLKSAGVSCELELLYGLPKRRMLKIAREHRIAARIYVPYGQAGLPYRLKDIVRNPRIFTWFARDLIRGSAII
jgi:proline dehydrogenase